MTQSLTYQKMVDPVKLAVELEVVPGLAPVGEGFERSAQFTVQATPTTVAITIPDDVASQLVDSVVITHDPGTYDPFAPALHYHALHPVEARMRTLDATPVEVFRFHCDVRTVYQASLVITGIDAGNFATKVMEGRFAWKRIQGNALITGVTVVSDLHDAVAASWLPNYAAQGADIVFTVAGATGRTIDWLLVGDLGYFMPAGSA